MDNISITNRLYKFDCIIIYNFIIKLIVYQKKSIRSNLVFTTGEKMLNVISNQLLLVALLGFHTSFSQALEQWKHRSITWKAWKAFLLQL